jgi:beta-galactosidase
VVIKIPAAKIVQPKPGSEFWLRVSFHLRTNSLWAPAGFEVAWQQLKLKVESPPVLQIHAGKYPAITIRQDDNGVLVGNTNFNVGFSRKTGTLDQYAFSPVLANGAKGVEGHEFLSPGPIQSLNGLQAWRAPTDNDKGFGKWLARDWRDAGLSNLVRHVDAFEVRQLGTNEVQVVTVVTDQAADGGIKLKTTWMISGNGSVDMDANFEPFGHLPLLPRVGVVFALEPVYGHLQWYGRGPWENYPDRKDSTDMGVWSGTVDQQYVPYVRPQENGNKEDARWLALTDASTASAASGLRIEAVGEPFSFSALHFTAGDLASARHNYELKPRREIILSLDAKQCGLGNSSCGPGVLERYAVPPAQTCHLHLRFSPCAAMTSSDGN